MNMSEMVRRGAKAIAAFNEHGLGRHAVEWDDYFPEAQARCLAQSQAPLPEDTTAPRASGCR